jgi:hypothetical protein
MVCSLVVRGIIVGLLGLSIVRFYLLVRAVSTFSGNHLAEGNLLLFLGENFGTVARQFLLDALVADTSERNVSTVIFPPRVRGVVVAVAHASDYINDLAFVKPQVNRVAPGTYINFRAKNHPRNL